jgi:hypothetical protein
VKECRACFFHEGATGIRKLHDAALFPNKKAYLVLVFKLGDLFAEGRLGDAQDMSGSREVQLFGENNDRLQVTSLDVGKHCSEPRSGIG